MVKILAIGDFHGKIPLKLLRRIKKEDFDLIITPGDFCGDKELSNIIFKKWYNSGKEIWEIIGRKKYNELEKRSFDSGTFVLNQLNSFNRPVFGVRGNWDYKKFIDIGLDDNTDLKIKKFENKIKKLKNIFIIDFKRKNFDNFNFIGYPGGSYPGHVNKNSKSRLITKFGLSEGLKRFNKIKSDNKKYFNILKKKFQKNKINVFISHNSPLNTKIDIIKHGPQKGKHYGSYLTKKIIKDLNPVLVICGHLHEYQKAIRIGKTLIVNPGASVEGKATIINFPENKKYKIKIKFLK
jgi:Icc-related predicted phosphoesterase